MLLSLGSATLSLPSPAVTSSSGHSANLALPREVHVGISCSTGNSSYSWSSLPLPGAPVLGVVTAFWGIFHPIMFYKWSGRTKDLFKIKKLRLNSSWGWIREYVRKNKDVHFVWKGNKNKFMPWLTVHWDHLNAAGFCTLMVAVWVLKSKTRDCALFERKWQKKTQFTCFKKETNRKQNKTR